MTPHDHPGYNGYVSGCLACAADVEAEQDRDERRAAREMTTRGVRPHYELNDGTCVSCLTPWPCASGWVTL